MFITFTYVDPPRLVVKTGVKVFWNCMSNMRIRHFVEAERCQMTAAASTFPAQLDRRDR
jgi:hypothetical protein